MAGAFLGTGPRRLFRCPYRCREGGPATRGPIKKEKLWGPVEEAVRNLAKDMIALRQKIAQEGRPADPVERLQRAADAATTRGEDLHKLAAAAQPLWASLSQDQKRRLPCRCMACDARTASRLGAACIIATGCSSLGTAGVSGCMA